ncbi:MAG: hypothetical protein JST94_00075 [Bacteroidetes bacterium]|nr:hypothetical protein [Bacteroidota bacterium]MBS1642346.1 hypothetical protein [Bacteroidota bacterium]MBS1669847.1 hypothetical protein [Bacteroidota bacterium]
MKKILFIICFAFAAVFVNAQVMSAKMEWLTIKSNNLKCWVCKEKLMDYLKTENAMNMQNGMTDYRFNLLQGEIKIFYHPDRVSADEIRTAMNNAGFDADSTKAEPDAYKKLPPICKRAEDGGGPTKGKPCHIQPIN